MAKEYVFSVHPERNTFSGARYFSEECTGMGADSLDEVEVMATRIAARHAARLPASVVSARIYTGRYQVRIRKPCRVCSVTGIQHGCKRKACEACAGRGTTDVHDVVISAEDVVK
jgi:DnaJ-class molecular chaperone